MAFKSRFLNWLLGFRKKRSKVEEVTEPPVQEIPQVPEEPPVPEETVVDQLELSSNHPFNQLYDLWALHVEHAPLPRLCLDDGDLLPEDLKEDELVRLRKELTSETSFRWRSIPEQWKIFSALSKEEQEMETEEHEIPQVAMDALPMIYVSADRMAAWLIVFPPVGQGKELDREMLNQALEHHFISFGVDTELLERLSDEPNRYFRLFPLAKGQPVVHGKDGYIKDHYDRVTKHRFAEDARGRVDYFNPNIIQNAKKGDVICEAIPPVEGVAGRNVQNMEIPYRPGKEAKLPKGRNTEISEDGTKLVALTSGRVDFSGRSFQVKSVLDIDGDVDFSTGNINFVGDVHIHGDVSSGFTVRSIGNITVDGVVEAAEIEAGGDLIIGKGISGDSRAVIRSHHDIYAKYMESCRVHSRGDLKTDCIVNCDVYCDGEVDITSGKGTIVGGRIRAARGINAKIVGSKSESVTTVYLGGQPCADFERDFLLQSVEKLEAEMEKVERQPDSPAKIQRLGKIRLDLSVGRMKLAQFDKELAKIQAKLVEQGGCRLRCDIAYPGMVLNIDDVSLNLTRETSSVVARLVNGEIRLM